MIISFGDERGRLCTHGVMVEGGRLPDEQTEPKWT
jgi:hypothetical protein